jgi:hypothetical protein
MSRLGALIVAAAMVAGPVLPAAASAVTAEDGLRLSIDGSSWAPELRVPLFTGTRVWVPGDEETMSFWVQNDTDDPASLTVDFVGSNEPTLLDVAGVSLTATVDGLSRSITSDMTAELVTVDRVEARALRRIDLTVAMPPTTANDAQRRSLEVALVVRLTEIVDPAEGLPQPPVATSPGGAAATEPAAREPGPLPRTGRPLSRVLGAAVLVLLVGVSLSMHRGGRRARR